MNTDTDDDGFAPYASQQDTVKDTNPDSGDMETLPALTPRPDDGGRKIAQAPPRPAPPASDRAFLPQPTIMARSNAPREPAAPSLSGLFARKSRGQSADVRTVPPAPVGDRGANQYRDADVFGVRPLIDPFGVTSASAGVPAQPVPRPVDVVSPPFGANTQLRQAILGTDTNTSVTRQEEIFPASNVTARNVVPVNSAVSQTAPTDNVITRDASAVLRRAEERLARLQSRAEENERLAKSAVDSAAVPIEQSPGTPFETPDQADRRSEQSRNEYVPSFREPPAGENPAAGDTLNHKIATAVWEEAARHKRDTAQEDEAHFSARLRTEFDRERRRSHEERTERERGNYQNMQIERERFLNT